MRYVLLLSLISCAHTTYYVDVNRYTTVDETESINDLQVDYIVESTAKMFDQQDKIDNLTITFTSGAIKCGLLGEVNGCYKCNSGEITIKMTNETNQCIVKSSLVHELMHFFLERTRNTCDPMHRFEGIWGVSGLLNSINVYYTEELCKEQK